MRELVLSCALALLAGGCVEVVSHRDDFDAGNPDVKPPSDAASEPEAPAGQCTSGVWWTGGSMPSPMHYPGRPCLNSGCHDSKAKVPFTIAGTVYPLKGDHDDDDCNGINSSQMPSAIALLDENGAEIGTRIQINAAGNFSSTRSLPPSFRVKLFSQGRDISQMSPVTDGNCNSCHSKDGVAGAKGRIVPQPP